MAKTTEKTEEKMPTETGQSQMAVFEEKPEWLNEGNAGNEEVTSNDRVLPRIDIIQAISPQIKKNDPKFIAGAEQGMIFNTVTGELYGESAIIVPVYFRKEWTLWKLRKEGGGFNGAFASELEGKREQKSKDNPDSYELLETHQHFVLLMTDSGVKEGVISCTKSKLKFSRNLNTLCQVAGVDRFAKGYKLGVSEATSTKGDYWAFKVSPAGFVNKEMYDLGKSVYELIKAGAVDVDRSQDEHSDDESQGQTYESAEL